MEILNTFKVVDVPEWASLLFVMLGIGIVLCFVVTIWYLFDYEVGKATISAVLAIGFIMGFALFKTYCKEEYMVERYEVKVDETMTAQELAQSWNIIEIRGEIFVVERRNQG